MWLIWSVAKATRKAPSDLLGINEWASEMLLGLDDTWTALQFDAAVSLFGIWIDNRLNEYDYESKPPRPKYRLENLLNDKPSMFASLKGIKGIHLKLKEG